MTRAMEADARDRNERIFDVTYRQASEEDLPHIAAMYVKLHARLREFGERGPRGQDVGEAYVESFRGTLGRFSILYVAEVDKRVMGFQGARIKPVARYLGEGFVGETAGKWTQPEVRRMGIGKELTRLTLQWLREKGVHSVELQVSEGNTASWALFQSMGFRPESRRYRLMWEDFVGEE